MTPHWRTTARIGSGLARSTLRPSFVGGVARSIAHSPFVPLSPRRRASGLDRSCLYCSVSAATTEGICRHPECGDRTSPINGDWVRWRLPWRRLQCRIASDQSRRSADLLAERARSKSWRLSISSPRAKPSATAAAYPGSGDRLAFPFNHTIRYRSTPDGPMGGCPARMHVEVRGFATAAWSGYGSFTRGSRAQRRRSPSIPTKVEMSFLALSATTPSSRASAMPAFAKRGTAVST